MMIFTRKWIVFLLFWVLSVKAVNAAGDIVIIGKVENPTSQFVTIHYKKNLFSLEQGLYEAQLNEHNVFHVKIKIPEPRSVTLEYSNKKLKLFLVPNDTLRLFFKASDMLSTVKFEGLAALPNKYLVQAVKKFPDWVEEKEIEKVRSEKSPRDYQAYIDNLFFEKRRFFENYPSEDKDYFTSDFLDFASNDITYWRTFQLMMYYKEYGLNNKDNTRFIDDNYFNFLFDTENVYYKALNNDYYLQFLELYVTYIRERDADKYGKTNLDAIEERSRQVQIVKPKSDPIWLLEDPFTSKRLLVYLGQYDEMEYLNLITNVEFEFVCPSVTYKDVYLKVQTKDGVKGWVPQKLVTMTDKSITEKTVYTRQCLNQKDPLCGFSTLLHGKVLYHTALRDMMYSFLTMHYTDMEKQLNAYTASNTNFPEYNNILKDAYQTTLKNREKGGDRMYIPQSCFVDDLAPNPNKTLLVDIVPEKNTLEVEKQQTTVGETPKKPEPSPVEAPKPAEKIAEKAADKKVEKPSNETETSVVNTPTGVNITISPKSVQDEKPKTPEKAVELPVENTVKSVEKSATANMQLAQEKKTMPPVQEVQKEMQKETQKDLTITPAPSTSETTGFKIIQGEKKVELNTQQEIVPWTGMLDYKPDGKPVIFNGLVLNDNIPIFKLTDVNGKEVSQQDLLGKIVVIDFWASWCGPCQAQLTHSKKLADKYKDANVIFVFISMDADVEAWKTALKEKNLPGIHANDKTIIPINFSIQGLPNVFIIDQKGKIAHNSMLKSPVSDDQMIEILLRTP